MKGSPIQSTIPVQIGSVPSTSDFTHSLTGKAVLTIAATAFVTVCAHVSLPIYFTPVPLTLQTFAVILIGLALGPSLGFSAMVLYLAEGAIGLPVFSPQGPGGIAQLLGPTAGFLFSYPLAAAAAGFVVRTVRIGRSQFPAAILAGLAASVVIFSMGSGWIAHLLHLSPAAAWLWALPHFCPARP